MPVNDSSADVSRVGTVRTALGSGSLRQLAARVLARRAGTTDSAESLEAAASAAYADLVRVSAPVIGQAGVDALIDRAFHLVQREFPGLVRPAARDRRGGFFAHAMAGIPKHDVAVATEAVVAVFAAFVGLLVTFIGESLTAGLLRKAWPDAFSNPNSRSDEV